MKNFLRVSASVAAIAFASAAWADNNTVYLDQTGTDVQATIDQESSGNSVGSSYFGPVDQNGVGGGVNTLTVTQGANGGGGNWVGVNAQAVQNGYSLSASIQQPGGSNDVEFQQYGNTNGLTVVQNTNSNVITSYQNGSNLSITDTQGGVDGNHATFTQYGSNNTIGGDPLVPNEPFPGYGAYYNSTQAGTYYGETINAYQSGTGNALGFLQNGSGDTINSNQYGSASAYIYQAGSGNTASGFQTGTSTALVYQTGTGGTVYYNQNGAGNSVSFAQAGISNGASVVQTGSSNSATITQK